jgi:hypothetical protein
LAFYQDKHKTSWVPSLGKIVLLFDKLLKNLRRNVKKHYFEKGTIFNPILVDRWAGYSQGVLTINFNNKIFKN